MTKPADIAASLSPAQRRWATFAVALAVVMSVLDGVMLNVALPSIQRSLHASPASAIWVVNAYQLAAALVLLPLGKSADVLGHHRVYLACLALFTVASVGCAFSDDLVTLSVWRFIQGCGGAGIMGITNALLRFIFPPRMLARGISTNSLVVALALASGPTIASVIVELASWPWLFLINVPIGIALLVIGVRVLPRIPRSGHDFDMGSAALCIATFALLILALDSKAHQDSLWPPALLGMSGIIFTYALVHHQLRRPAPLFPVDLLRTRMFGLSVGTMFCAAMAQVMAYVCLPFFFQYDLGRSQLETGLLFLPWPIAIACAAPLAGRMADRHPAGALCGLGLAIFSAGLLSLAFLREGAAIWDIAWRMALCGLGYGFFQPPSSRALITSVPVDRSGSASVMGATGRVLGQAAGAAVVASLFRLAPDHGRTLTLLVATGVALVAMLASLGRGVRNAAPTPA